MRGELSASCIAITYLFGIFKVLDGLADADMFPQMASKFSDTGTEAESVRVMQQNGIVNSWASNLRKDSR